MAIKSLILVVLVVIAATLTVSQAGVVPLVGSAAYVAPYASSYNAHVINHAIAAPVAAPLVAAAPSAQLTYAAYPYAYNAAPYFL